MSGHGAFGVVLLSLARWHLRLLQVSLVKNLLNHLILILRVKLGGENVVGGRVELALGAMLVGDEDLERRDEVSHGNALVSLPLVVRLDIINENDEVVVVALVVALGLEGFAASHLDGVVAEGCRVIRWGIMPCLVLVGCW